MRSSLRATLGVPTAHSVKTPLCPRPFPDRVPSLPAGACAPSPLCEAASPAAQEPDAAVALFVVHICCHLHDQKREKSVTPGTSQVGISPFLIVPPWVTAEQVRALLLPAPVTLDEGSRGAFSPCSRCSAETPFLLLPHGRRGCYRWAFNGTDIVGGKP